MAGPGQPRAGPLVARAVELSWVADYEPEVASDLSVLHRVDDPEAMDCARYFRLAELLPHYDGAVRSALTRDLAAERAHLDPDAHPGGGPYHQQYRPVGVDDGLTVTHDGALPFVSDSVRGDFTGKEPVIVDDVAALAALSQQAGPGFPSIEYRGPGG